MTRTTEWQPQGVLNPTVAAEKFTLLRVPPAPVLAPWIERYWIINWDLRGQAPHLVQTLPQPYANLVIEADKACIYGVASQKYTNLLEGKGRVFGVKFKPGACYPLLQQPLATLTDHSLPIDRLLGDAGTMWAEATLALDDPAAMCALADDFWSPRLPAPDETVTLVGAIVNQIMADRTMCKVDDVAHHFGMSRRTLQRLFHRYVGVSPKWVITRYRLHDAAEQLINGAAVPLATMAQDLGYFDQAHFIKEFKAAVGLSPAEYARAVEFAV